MSNAQGLTAIELEHSDLGDGKIRQRAKSPHVTFLNMYPLRNDPTIPFDYDAPPRDDRTWYEKEDG
jgi:hypothetical protein